MKKVLRTGTCALLAATLHSGAACLHRDHHGIYPLGVLPCEGLMVQRELGKKGVVMSPDSEKTVILKMVYPNWVRGAWTMRGRVTLQAQLGNGKQVTIDADYKTAGNAMRAFNGGILRAVEGLLEDEVFAAYLNE